jgi:hypothetical protein
VTLTANIPNGDHTSADVSGLIPARFDLARMPADRTDVRNAVFETVESLGSHRTARASLYVYVYMCISPWHRCSRIKVLEAPFSARYWQSRASGIDARSASGPSNAAESFSGYFAGPLPKYR